MGEVVSSIFKLLNEYEICIPAIQREYVQGSTEEKIQQVRQILLKDIIYSLDSEANKLNLGIIYGIIDKKLFYPLDGQQRLTTLFLLYWFVAIKEKQSISSIKFTYEIRYSANSFFKELLNDARKEEFLKLLNEKDKDSFVNLIKTRKWFKTQWFNDITVLSVLNTIGDIINLNLDNKKLNDYYKKLTRKEGCPVFFYFLEEIDEDGDPYKNSSKNYIRINSRGKMLESFENIKARMEIIERNLKNGHEESKDFNESNLFTWKYDTEYIDLFYDIAQKESTVSLLEEKTKIINDATVNILTNLYNILIFSSENQNLELKQCVNKEDFYNHIYKISKNGFVGDKKKLLEKIGKEYFEFIDIIINSINKDKKIVTHIEHIFQKINEYSNKNEQNNILLAYVKYIYYYFNKHKDYVCEEKLIQLDYVLTNLKYKKWNIKEFHINDIIIKDMAQAEDVYSYFLSKDYIQIEQHFELKKNIFGIDDIRVRFKEQSTKFKIINKINQYGDNKKYNFFNDIEELYDERTIHFLLFISDMWNEDVSDEKVKMLLSYIDIAKKTFRNQKIALLWRKLLAIVSNSNRGELLCSEDIDKGANKHIKGKNVWYWNDDFYHINDNISDDRKKLLEFETKIRLVKDAYDFIISINLVNIENDQLNEDALIVWCGEKFDSSYNTCWLKYAIDRNHDELLINKISYNENMKKTYIEVKNNSININQNINFFTRVLFWDKVKANDADSNIYFTSEWDYQSKRISSNILHSGIKLTNLKKTLINQFETKLLSFSKIEKNLYDDKYRYRYFFYCSYQISVPNLDNSIFLLKKDKIIIFQFIENLKYIEYKCDLEIFSKNADHKFHEFTGLVNGYSRWSDFEDEKWNVNDYVYNNEWIHKCEYKLNQGEIKFNEFEEVKTDLLDFKQFIE